MADFTIKSLDEFEAVFGGGFRRVRAGLGVSSFGLAVMDLPPNFHHYPDHTHEHDAQEEVYSVIEGKVTLRIGDTEHELVPGLWARVGPGEHRRFVTGDQPARIVAIGGTPGEAYEPPEFTEEGGADPPLAKE